MRIINKTMFVVFVFLSSTLLLSQNHQIISNKDYITGEDGVIRMKLNIIGHVKNSGSYLVYDGIDILSAISLAGGYLQGADLKNIIIYGKNGSVEEVNLDKILNQNNDVVKPILKPNDTIHIEQKKLSKIFISSNLPSLFLSILNIVLTINRDS